MTVGVVSNMTAGVVSNLATQVKFASGLFVKKGDSNEDLEAAVKEKFAEEIFQHETELSAISDALTKAQRELGYQEQQANHYKRMASELAE